MHALVYNGAGQKNLQERPKPTIKLPTDAIVKVDLHLEKLWSHNITITTGLVDTFSIPLLLKTVQSKRIDTTKLIAHRFTLAQILDAYDTFGRAADTKALKAIVAA